MFEVNITYAPLTHTCWTKPMLIRRFINIKNTLNGRSVEVLRLFTRIHVHRHHPACYVPTIDLLERRTLKEHTQTYVYQRTISDKRDRIDAIEFELKRRSHKSHYRLFHSVEFSTHLRSGVKLNDCCCC